MRFSTVLFVCSLLIAVVLAKPSRLDQTDDDSCTAALFPLKPTYVKPKDITPGDCIKCEAVIQVFHFLNDAILGGEGEEELRQKVLDFCKFAPSFLNGFCDEIRNGNLWDTIYKALRDSLLSFYCYVGMDLLGCDSLKRVQDTCGS